MSWEAVVETWTKETLLFIPALPGFQVNAESPDDALADAGSGSTPSFIGWAKGSCCRKFPVAEHFSCRNTSGKWRCRSDL